MKKKIGLIISISMVLVIASITFLSCDLVHRFRPSGVYTSDEYVNADDDKTYRFLIKFEEENADKDYCKGKVQFAYQYKVNGTSEWKTENLFPPKKYKIEFSAEGRHFINLPESGIINIEFFKDDQNCTCSSSSVYKVPLKTIQTSDGTFTGYNLTHIDYEFPTSVS